MFLLMVGWRAIAERRVKARLVIVVINELDQIQLEFFQIGVLLTIDLLLLERYVAPPASCPGA